MSDRAAQWCFDSYITQKMAMGKAGSFRVYMIQQDALIACIEHNSNQVLV
jgi:hypothetical protein